MFLCQLAFVYRILGMVFSCPLPLSIYTLIHPSFPPPPTPAPDTRGISLNHISDHVTPSCLRNQFPPFSTAGFVSLGTPDLDGQKTVVGAVLYIAGLSLLPRDASRTRPPIVGRIRSHHTLISGTCDCVQLHDKENVRLQMELKVAHQLALK